MSVSMNFRGDRTIGDVSGYAEQGATMRIVLRPDMLPMAEEIELEGEDGTIRAGIFVPYEPFASLRGNEGPYLHFIAYPVKYMRGRTVIGGNSRSHAIYPYHSLDSYRSMLWKGMNHECCGWMRPLRNRRTRKVDGVDVDIRMDDVHRVCQAVGRKETAGKEGNGDGGKGNEG